MCQSFPSAMLAAAAEIEQQLRPVPHIESKPVISAV